MTRVLGIYAATAPRLHPSMLRTLCIALAAEQAIGFSINVANRPACQPMVARVEAPVMMPKFLKVRPLSSCRWLVLGQT